MKLPGILESIVRRGADVNADGTVKGITEVKADGSLHIKRKWFGFRFGLFFFFLVTSLCVALIILKQHNIVEVETKGSSDFQALLFLIPISLGFLYNFLCHLCNTTHIIADTNSVTVKHRPLPRLGNRNVKLDNITRLEVFRGGTRESGNYEIHYHDRQGQEHTLVDGGAIKSGQARHICQQLEAFLNANRMHSPPVQPRKV